MSSLRFSIDILESDEQISKEINKAILQELKSRLPVVFKKSQNYILNTVIEAIKNQPEYISLLSGSLKYEFGLPDASSRINAILETIERSLYVEYEQPKITGSNIVGGFLIGIINAGFSDILSLKEATLITEKGTPLEWLKWLLLEGDKTIIIGYDFNIGNYKNSRTGGGIMSPSFQGAWRVPPEFAGTIENNWIIRAVESIQDQIESQLVSLLQKM
jgi:hypothetical protein